MRSLSETLVAAQQGRGARPCVQVTVDDRHVGVPRLRPQRLYAGSEAGGPCTMVASQGYVLRAWTDAAGDLRLCRALAGAGSGWNAWTVLAQGVDSAAQLALAANGAGNAYLLYVGGGGRELYCRRSSDSGGTWAAAELVYQASPGVQIISLAAVCTTAHDCIALFADHAGEPEPDDLVHVAWLRLGQWTDAVWARPAGSNVAGLAALSTGSDPSFSTVHFVLCGNFEDTTAPAVRLYQLQLSDQGLRQWLHRGALISGDAGDFTWSHPALIWAGAGSGQAERPRLFLTQASLAGQRSGQLFLPRLDAVGPLAAGDWTPLRAAADPGVAATVCGDSLYWGNAAEVWSSAVYGGSGEQRQDVSADVVNYVAREGWRHSSGGLELSLDNRSQRYSPGGEAAAPLRLGAQISLRQGYHTASGAELSYLAPFWIGEIERQETPSPRVNLRCYDGWGKLQRSLAERAWEWQAAPAAVLQTALERLGFVYSDDGSPSLYCAGTPPRFALQAGQAWAGLVAQVLDYCGCMLRFFVNPPEEAGWPSARAHVYTPGAELAYSYGPSQHPALACTLIEREPAAAWAQAYGQEASGLTAYGDALDLDSIEALGFAPVRQLVDERLNSTRDVTPALAAAFLLGRSRRGGRGGSLVSRTNAGLEVGDVISIELEGQAQLRRVLAIEHQYDRRSGLYRQRLELEGV